MCAIVHRVHDHPRVELLQSIGVFPPQVHLLVSPTRVQEAYQAKAGHLDRDELLPAIRLLQSSTTRIPVAVLQATTPERSCHVRRARNRNELLLSDARLARAGLDAGVTVRDGAH